MRPSTVAQCQLCPGSNRMQNGLPDDDSEISRKGVLLHTYSAHPEYDRRILTPQDQDLLALADRLTEDVIDRIKPETGETFIEFVEKYLVMNGVPNFGGTPDRVRFFKKTGAAWVNDLKFGFIVVERADLNLQLRSYGVMAYDYSGGKASKIFVSVTQPRAPYDERVTIAEYLPEDIEASRTQILEIFEAAEKPDAPLIPGEDQCRNCRAKLVCSAFQSAMQVPAVITPDKALSKAAREAYLVQRLEELNDEQLEKVIAACSLAKMVSTSANDEVRRRGGTEHLTFAKDSEVREVVDVRRAMSLLSLSGLERTELFDCVQGLSLTKLEELLRKKNPNWKLQNAKDWVNKKLKSVIELQTRKGRIMPK